MYYNNTYNFEEQSKKIIKQPYEIKNYYVDEADFKQHHNSLIFINENNLKKWLTSIKTYNNLSSNNENIYIKNKLDISFGELIIPYFYMAPDKSIYLIQNVKNGDLLKALNVAYTWNIKYLNLGFDAPSYQNKNLPYYILYGISETGSIVPIADHTNQENNFLQIILYGIESNRYSAMLKLL